MHLLSTRHGGLLTAGQLSNARSGDSRTSRAASTRLNLCRSIADLAMEFASGAGANPATNHARKVSSMLAILPSSPRVIVRTLGSVELPDNLLPASTVNTADGESMCEL